MIRMRTTRPAWRTRGKCLGVPRARGRDRFGPTGWVVALGVAGLACAPVVVHERVPPPPEPFARYPYLVEVRPDGARVAWRTEGGAPASLQYSLPSSGGDTIPGTAGPGPDAAVHLSGLPSDVIVRYAVAPRGYTSTPEFRFRTAPPKGSHAPFRFLVWGDSGSGTAAQLDVARQIALRHRSDPFNFALHTGDVVYPDGLDRYYTERHFRVYREWLTSVPVYPTPGNHDVRKDGGRAYAEAFLLPRAIDAERRYYAFDYANAHFVALDSSEERYVRDRGGDLRDPDSEQRTWLAHDLAAAAADTALDWIIVYLHHPPYSAAGGWSGHGSDDELREGLVPLFDRFRVDLVLAGHDHNYERSKPLRRNVFDPSGTVYIVTGGGGGSRTFRNAGRAGWTEVSGKYHHFVEIEIAGDSLCGRVIDRAGEVADTFCRTARRRCQNCTGAQQRQPPTGPGAEIGWYAECISCEAVTAPLRAAAVPVEPLTTRR